MYLREYRTQFHIGKTYRVSEPTVCRIVTRVENTLMASGQYTLPGKQVLSGSDLTYALILVDATETPCERPKKSGPAREVPQLGQDTETEKVLQREKEASHA